MPRKVKCQDTGEYSTNDIAFKAENGKYYSSENAYNLWKNNKEYREKCIVKVYDVLGYKSFMKLPTYFYKKLSEWQDYGFDVVLKCIENKASDCEWAIKNKDFNSEVAKIMYICAIFENGLNDALKQIVKERKDNQVIENHTIEEVDFESIGVTKKSNDATNLLGDL